MVRGEVNGVVTFYAGRHYHQEVDGSETTVRKYYALGSMTVAVRSVEGTQDTLKWVLGDHLGSTSVTANEDGSWNSELRYTAFGEARYSSGITPTEYRYTGQLEQAEVGLYYYGARWYDTVSAHFVQADTIVPSPGSSMAWDRYAYVMNNPVKYSDPSGHYAFEDTPDDPYFIPASNVVKYARRSTTYKDYSTDERRKLIYERGLNLATKADDPLQKFAELVDYASTLYDPKKDQDNFVLDLTCAINNYCTGHPVNVWKAGFGSRYDIGNPNYFLGQDLFEGKGSWSASYYDNTDNQMYHIWFYVAVSYFDTLPVALVGNYYHDPVYVPTLYNGTVIFSRNDALIDSDNGVSIEDFNLGYAGAYLGRQLRLGFIQPNGVGSWIIENLSQ